MLAANFSDPENARIIYLAAGGLIVMAAALIAGTIWWWRSSAVEHPVLGPLEVMGTKPFITADDDLRRDLIESARPGAMVGDELDDELVLDEGFDEVFPEGLAAASASPFVDDAHVAQDARFAPDTRVAPATRVAPTTSARPTSDRHASVGADPFEPFDQAYDDSDELAISHDRGAGEDLDALADDIWGPASTNDRPAPRPIDPLLRSDDIW